MKEIPECVLDRLTYNHETGAFIWKYFNKKHPRLFGKEAGTVRKSKNGEIRKVIKIDGVAYFAHRLAWFIFYNEQPNVVDHINGNTLDNRICNLRNVSKSENAKNHGKKINKSGLPCGIRLLPSGKYQARVTCDGSVVCLGTFKSSQDAQLAYLNKRNELFKEYSRKAA